MFLFAIVAAAIPLVGSDSRLPSVRTSSRKGPSHAHAPVSPVDRRAVHSAYGRVPLYFEPNLGQFDARALYMTRGAGHSLFLTDSGTVMVLKQREGQNRDPLNRQERPGKVEQAVVRMTLVGARSAKWIGLKKQPGISNYFIGNDPAKWRTDVPNYGRVEARGVYAGVDLVYYGNQGQFEFDLNVAP